MIRTCRGATRGFTLIELLVVIAIIAILAAILFPVLARAKGKSQQIACLSNIKQLGLAFLQYTDDWDGGFPWDGSIWTPTTTGWVSVPGGDYSIDIRAGSLWPYTKDAKVYLCPVDWKKLKSNYSPITYAMNQELGRPRGVGPPLSLSDVRQPARCIMLIEEDDFSALGIGLNDGTFVPFAGDTPSQGQLDWPARRHFGGGNHVFVDGHAKWYPYTELVKVSAAGKPIGKTDLWKELFKP